jgi:tryptophanyl-tRNA synthetase
VRKKVMSMYTDPNRISADVPGRVEGNPIFIYHDAFNPNQAQVADFKARYGVGKVGDVEVKEALAVALNAFLDPIRERRAGFEAHNGLAERVIYEGTQRAAKEGETTVAAMRKAMGLAGLWNRISRKAREAIEKDAAEKKG